jgi:release factor glutamine methyltransferase
LKNMSLGNNLDNKRGDTIFSLIVKKLRAAGCVFAEEEAHLLISTAQNQTDLDDMVDQRVSGLPLEYVVGWAEFCGIRITIEPGVFVPRPRTEFLVNQAVTIAHPGAVVVDLCCGSGAVGVALANNLDGIELHATDIDVAAVQCARRNVIPMGGYVYEGDLYESLPANLKGRVNILIANAPYVPTKAVELLPREARLHEARVALDGGMDGLDIQRRVAESATIWLAPGGYLLIETSVKQAPQTSEIFSRNGLIPHVVHSEELDATVVIGTLPIN